MLTLWEDAATRVRVGQLNKVEEVRALVRLFEGVAQAEGWQPGAALRMRWPQSVHFALAAPEAEQAAEAEQSFIGGLQVVLPDARGRLPCHELWPEAALMAPGHARQGRGAHVAMLAVEADYRGHSGLFWALAVEMWRYCVGAGITTLYLEVTPRVLPIYRRLGWPLHIQGELRSHWGEDCYLCTLGIPEVAQVLLERADSSPYYRQIVAQAFRVTLPAQGEDPAKLREVSPTGGG